MSTQTRASRATAWDGLTPPYATIVADPPWRYTRHGRRSGTGTKNNGAVSAPRYSMMDVADISEMSVADIAADDAVLYVWTTNKYLRDTFRIVERWGFRPGQILAWCKPRNGLGPGGDYVNTTEFIVYARRGTPETVGRVESTWFDWPRAAHSVKPAAFLDVVERVNVGPYVELFARAPRLGWDHWGHGYEQAPITPTSREQT